MGILVRYERRYFGKTLVDRKQEVGRKANRERAGSETFENKAGLLLVCSFCRFSTQSV